MGVHHEDGYSATVEGYFVVGNERFRLAKTNGSTFVLAEPCAVAPATQGELVITIDENEQRCSIEVPDGVVDGQIVVPYKVTVPF